MAEKPYDKITRIMREKLTKMMQDVINHQHEKRKQISGTERNQDGIDAPFSDGSANVYVNLINNDQDKIRVINQALNMIDQGTYGICQDCNKPIPLARLEVAPFATLCIKCKTKREEKKGPHRR